VRGGKKGHAREYEAQVVKPSLDRGGREKKKRVGVGVKENG